MFSSPPPPVEIPPEHLDSFTMQGRIPVFHWLRDDRLSTPVHITADDYREAIRAIEERRFVYYGPDGLPFYDVFADHPVAGKSVLIWGLDSCNCDAFALWQKAAHVTIVDYNSPICDNPAVTVMTHDELAASGHKFDCAFSFSSFEHDGLGRYGDPVSPNGDLRAMQSARKYLRENGILFFGVPLGKDALVWNVHRIYGMLRLPLLLQGWLPLDAYRAYKGANPFQMPLGKHHQPLLVLRKTSGLRTSRADVLERLAHAESLAAGARQHDPGTKDTPLLVWILEILRRSNALV